MTDSGTQGISENAKNLMTMRLLKRFDKSQRDKSLENVVRNRIDTMINEFEEDKNRFKNFIFTESVINKCVQDIKVSVNANLFFQLKIKTLIVQYIILIYLE